MFLLWRLGCFVGVELPCCSGGKSMCSRLVDHKAKNSSSQVNLNRKTKVSILLHGAVVTLKVLCNIMQ